MIETITTFIIPQIIEEWIAVLLFTIIYFYYFAFYYDYDFATPIGISMKERALFVLILTFVITMISYLSLKIIFFIGGIFL